MPTCAFALQTILFSEINNRHIEYIDILIIPTSFYFSYSKDS
jgi:hypothetical protein